MKKLLLGLGAATAAIAPIATVVACGSSSDSKKEVESKTIGAEFEKAFDKQEVMSSEVALKLKEEYKDYLYDSTKVIITKWNSNKDNSLKVIISPEMTKKLYLSKGYKNLAETENKLTIMETKLNNDLKSIKNFKSLALGLFKSKHGFKLFKTDRMEKIKTAQATDDVIIFAITLSSPAGLPDTPNAAKFTKEDINKIKDILSKLELPKSK